VYNAQHRERKLHGDSFLRSNRNSQQQDHQLLMSKFEPPQKSISMIPTRFPPEFYLRRRPTSPHRPFSTITSFSYSLWSKSMAHSPLLLPIWHLEVYG
jgi:hypothetical protein